LERTRVALGIFDLAGLPRSSFTDKLLFSWMTLTRRASPYSSSCRFGASVITRKTPEIKILIEWWWHAERYTKNELLRAFKEAVFQDPSFLLFPLRYTWLNRATYAVEARFAISRENCRLSRSVAS
jgi:hypothetical protein